MKLFDWKLIGFGFLVGLNYLDYLTTQIILNLGGMESNPLMAYLINHYGMGSVFWFKLVTLGAFLLLLKYISLRIIIMVDIIYLSVVTGNVLFLLSILLGK